jgi:hypothetical protein
MGKQISLTEMILECENEQKLNIKTEEISSRKETEGGKKEILPKERGSDELV